MSEAKAKRELVVVRVDEISPVDSPAIEENFVLIKTATGASDFSLADKDTAWDGAAAAKRVIELHTDNDGKIDWPRVHRAFFYTDPEKAETVGGHKLGFVDVIDGKEMAIPAGLVAVAGVLQGARGGVDIPDDEKKDIKVKVAVYYKRLGMVPPWEEKATKRSDAMRSEADQVAVTKACASVAEDIAKETAKKADPLPAHSAMMSEKLAAIAAGAKKIVENSATMDGDDLRKTICAMSSVLWSIESLSDMVALTKQATDAVEKNDEVAALEFVKEGVIKMNAEQEKKAKDEADKLKAEEATKKAKDEEEEKAKKAKTKADEEETEKAKKKKADEEAALEAEKAKKTKEDEEEDPAFKGSSKKFTKARVSKLVTALKTLGEVLKEIGVESLSDLAATAKAVKAVDMEKSLAGIGVQPDVEVVKRIEAREAEVVELRKRLDELEKVGVTKALGDDGSQGVQKRGGMWGGRILG